MPQDIAAGVTAFDLTPREATLECGFIGQPPHLHRPLDDLAITLHANLLSIARHRHYPQVDRLRQAAIEAHFLFAVVPAIGQLAEVKESQLDGLLDLVDVGSGQEDRRDVGVSHFHVPHRFGIGARGR